MANKGKSSKSTAKKSTTKKTSSKKVTNTKTVKKNVSVKKTTPKVKKEVVVKKVEATKEEKKSPNIIEMIVSLIIVAILGYIIYTNFFVIKNDIPEKIQLSSEKVEDVSTDVFGFIASKHNLENNNLVFFTNENKNVNNIKNEEILYVAYSMLSIEDKNTKGTVSDKCYNQKNYPSDCYSESFSKEVLEEQINNYFDDVKVKYENFYASNSLYCVLSKNMYNCTLNRKKEGYKVLDYTTLVNYTSSTKEADKLVVYSTLLTISRNGQGNDADGVYKDPLAKNKIDNLDYFINELGGVINVDTTKKLSEHYFDKITHYKTTFTLKNKNYVWHSTEIEK